MTALTHPAQLAATVLTDDATLMEQTNLLAGSTILVVDDEPVLSLTFAMVLRRAGATVHTAANGAEALSILERLSLERLSIDAMLCDRRMPIMDGLTLLRTLHQHGFAIPTLLFVNNVDHQDDPELERLHVVRLLTKPLPPRALLQAVQQVLARSAISRA